MMRPEFLIPLIIIFGLLIMGPKKLPEMGSAIGKTIKEFQKGMREVKEDQDAAETKQIAASSAASSAPASEAKPE
jgi:sec-independent protein translocase protein TatA